MTNLIVSTLKVTHMTILLFVVFAWILPFKSIWKIHLVFIPLMIVQWQFNQGTCILTNLENQLRKEVKYKQDRQGKFIKTILDKFFDPLPSDRTIKLYIYAVMGISWTISATRLFVLSTWT